MYKDHYEIGDVVRYNNEDYVILRGVYSYGSRDDRYVMGNFHHALLGVMKYDIENNNLHYVKEENYMALPKRYKTIIRKFLVVNDTNRQKIIEDYIDKIREKENYKAPDTETKEEQSVSDNLKKLNKNGTFVRINVEELPKGYTIENALSYLHEYGVLVNGMYFVK